jgi:hypothetical protein
MAAKYLHASVATGRGREVAHVTRCLPPPSIRRDFPHLLTYEQDYALRMLAIACDLPHDVTDPRDPRWPNPVVIQWEDYDDGS